MSVKDALIVLDPGHGGRDPGCIANGVVESIVTLQIAKHAATVLEANNVEVLLTRSSDVKVALRDRVRLSNKQLADYFVSIHVNASLWHSLRLGLAQGSQAYCYKLGTESEKLSRNILAEMSERINVIPWGGDAGLFTRKTLYVLAFTKCPATLIEVGFATNPSDAEHIKLSQWQKQCGEAIAHGILNQIPRM